MIGIIAAAGLAATNAVAELEPVVVEASRFGKTAVEMPTEVQVIGRGEIERSGAKSLPELLEKRAGGVYVRKLAENPSLQQVAMRGFGNNSFGRVLVMVDGERLNNPDMDAPNLGRVSLSSVERVEILHGPQTVVYGDQASAGMINVITRGGDYEKKTAFGVHGGSWGTVGTDFSTKGGDEDEKITYKAGAAYERSDGYRKNGGWSSWNANGSLRKEWDNGSYLGVSAFWSKNHYGLPGSLSRSVYRSNPQRSNNPDDWYDRISYGLNVSGGVVFNDENRLDVVFTASTKDWESRSSGLRSAANNYAYRITPRYTNTSALWGFGNEFQLGLDFAYERIDGAHQGPDNHVNYNRSTFAAYIRDEFFVTEEFSVFAGVRGERFSARIHERRGRALNSPACEKVAGEAGVNWRLIDGLKIYAKWSRFYRAPFADEMFVWDPAWGGQNYDLDPEYGNSFDTGFEYAFLDEFDVSANLYYTRMKKEIMYGGFGGLGYKNVNLPWDTERFGADFSFSWERDKVAYSALKYSFVDAHLDGGPYDNHRVPLVPRHQVSLSGGVWLWDEAILFGGYSYVGEQPSEADFNKSYPMVKGYGLFDIGVRYEPTWMKGLAVVFTVDNLFDKNYVNYATYGYYYPGAGRCYSVSVRYEF